MKIRPVGAELFHADGQTVKPNPIIFSKVNPIIVFRNFANAPEKC
jgi:hypothetical protein